MDGFWLVFWWSGPIGIGIFLVCLATMIYLLAKADAVSKQAKALQPRGDRVHWSGSSGAG